MKPQLSYHLKQWAGFIFLAFLALSIAGVIGFIQSKPFANVLKKFARTHLPADLGIDVGFEELEVKMFPPGFSIHNPNVRLHKKNVLSLPENTKVDAQSIEVTFRFFELLTGTITVNAIIIQHANIAVALDPVYFAEKENKKSHVGLPSTEELFQSLVHLKINSLSLIESTLSIQYQADSKTKPIIVQGLAHELTIGTNPDAEQLFSPVSKKSKQLRLAGYDLAIDLGETYFDTPWLKRTVSRLTSSASVSTRGIAIRNLALQIDKFNANISGIIEGDLLHPKQLQSKIDYRFKGELPGPFSTLLTFAPELTKYPLEGTFLVQGQAGGDLMDVENHFNANFSAMIENFSVAGWQFASVAMQGNWAEERLDLNHVKIAFPNGGLVQTKDLNLSIHPKEKAESFLAETELEFLNADLRQILGPNVDQVYGIHMFLSGKANIKVTKEVEGPLEIVSQTDLHIHKFSLDNQRQHEVRPLLVLLGLEEANVKATIHIDDEAVFIDEARMEVPSSYPDKTNLTAHGKLAFETGWDLDITGNAQLLDVKKIGTFDISGHGPLHWTIVGKKPDVLFSFDTSLKDGRYLNLNLGDVQGKIVLDDNKSILYLKNLQATQGKTILLADGSIDLGDTDDVALDVQLKNGTIPDVARIFSSLLKKSVPWYPYDLTGAMTGSVKVSGKTDLDKLSVLGNFDLANMEYMHEHFRSGKVYGGFDRGGFVAKNIIVKKKEGLIEGNITYSAANILEYNFTAESMTTSEIDQLSIIESPYQAPISFSAVGKGVPGQLKSTFDAKLGSGYVKNYLVPPATLNIKTENGRLQAAASVAEGRAVANLDMGWEKGQTGSLNVAVNGLDFVPPLVIFNSFLADDLNLYSEATGIAHLNFETGDLAHLSGKIDAQSFFLRRKDFSMTMNRPLAIDIKRGNYHFKDVVISGDNTQMEIDGECRDDKINYNLKGVLNLEILSLLVPEIESVRGQTAVKINVNGPVLEPHFIGSVKPHDVDVRVRTFEQPFENLKCDVDINDTKITLSNMTSNFAGGLVTGGGTAEVFWDKVPELDFKFLLDNPKIKFYPFTYARSSGRLRVYGSELPYKVEGPITIDDALIKENFNVTERSRMLKSSKFLPSVASGKPSDFQLFNLNIDATAPGGVFIKNEMFDAELRGDLKVINAMRTWQILGNVSVIRGKLFFKDNYFSIQNANIHFDNPAVLDPKFDLTGQTEMKGYKVLLNTAGKVSDYKLTLESQPPLSQNEIVNLLTLGVTTSEFKSLSKENRDAYSRDELYSLLFSQSGIHRDLQDKFGVRVRMDQTQALTPDSVFRAQSGNVGETVAPKVVLQKELTPRVTATAGTTVGVGDGHEQDINIEYRLGRYWLIQGVYEDQRGVQAKDSRTSVGADFKFRLRFK